MQKYPDYAKQARLLSKQIEGRGGVTLPHQSALEIIARLHGYRNWAACRAATDTVIARLSAAALRKKAINHVMRLAFTRLGSWAGKEEDLLSALRDTANEKDFRSKDRKALALFDDGQLRQSPDYVLNIDNLVPCLERQISATENLLRSLAQEDPADVLLNESIQDWRLAEGYSKNELPPEDCDTYQLRVTRNSNQFFVDIALPHTKVEELDGTPGLSLFIEINEGLPCVHVTNEVYGDQLLSIFGVAEGLVVRKASEEVSLSNAKDLACGQKVAGTWLVS